MKADNEEFQRLKNVNLMKEKKEELEVVDLQNLLPLHPSHLQVKQVYIPPRIRNLKKIIILLIRLY
jgi:hypothetical protein